MFYNNLAIPKRTKIEQKMRMTKRMRSTGYKVRLLQDKQTDDG
jgi:hypothetical protein